MGWRANASNYIHAHVVAGAGHIVVVAGAFVRGMRDVGYRSSAFAINELIDNSYQAGASRARPRGA